MNQLFDRSISDRFCHEATIKISSRFFDEAIRSPIFINYLTCTRKMIICTIGFLSFIRKIEKNDGYTI